MVCRDGWRWRPNAADKFVMDVVCTITDRGDIIFRWCAAISLNIKKV